MLSETSKINQTAGKGTKFSNEERAMTSLLSFVLMFRASKKGPRELDVLRRARSGLLTTGST